MIPAKSKTVWMVPSLAEAKRDYMVKVLRLARGDVNKAKNILGIQTEISLNDMMIS